MSRITFKPGLRFMWLGRVFLIKDILVDRKLLIIDQSFGGESRVEPMELYAGWAKGELRMEVHGLRGRKRPGEPIATEDPITSLEAIDPDLAKEARRRRTILQPLLNLPPNLRTRAHIQSYVDELRAASPQTKRHTRSQIGKAISCSSIERWLRAYEESGSHISALVPRTKNPRSKGQSRLEPVLEELIEEVLSESIREHTYKKAYQVYLELLNKIAEHNKGLAPSQHISPPSASTLYRRIDAKGAELVLNKPTSRIQERSNRAILSHITIDHLLERLEIDSTELDIMLVDDIDRKPIGRPTITLAKEALCGFIMGLYIGFERSSLRTVLSCLLHTVLPKPDVRQMYGTRYNWPPLAYGIPTTLVCDNGLEFGSEDFVDTCMEIGIRNVEWMPPRVPDWKGRVESFMRTHNVGLVHTLPGTTFSNPTQRADYDSGKNACISLSAFIRLVHMFLLDDYARSARKGEHETRSQKWERLISEGNFPAIDRTPEELAILLRRSQRRTIQRDGISFHTLRYQSPDLARIRTVLPANTQVRFKWDASDLGMIYVLDPTQRSDQGAGSSVSIGPEGGGSDGRWLPVSCTEPDYATGLTMWQLKYDRSRQNALLDRTAIGYDRAASLATRKAVIREERRKTQSVKRAQAHTRLLDEGSEHEPGRRSLEHARSSGNAGLVRSVSRQASKSRGARPESTPLPIIASTVSITPAQGADASMRPPSEPRNNKPVTIGTKTRGQNKTPAPSPAQPNAASLKGNAHSGDQSDTHDTYVFEPTKGRGDYGLPPSRSRKPR